VLVVNLPEFDIIHPDQPLMHALLGFDNIHSDQPLLLHRHTFQVAAAGLAAL